ncbi:MAG: hypothetical protein C0402_12860 [Thermodesulfovibrio sp.]|nr:hypothetical protein [Thermodesulfovibrio sp.]
MTTTIRKVSADFSVDTLCFFCGSVSQLEKKEPFFVLSAGEQEIGEVCDDCLDKVKRIPEFLGMQLQAKAKAYRDFADFLEKTAETDVVFE